MIHDFLRIADLTTDDLVAVLETAIAVKRDPSSVRGVASGRSAAVLFDKPSLRTRFSVEAALARIGAHPIGAYDQQTGLGEREPIDDAARVLERYVDAIVMRTFAHSRLEELAAASSVPVINALSDAHHPLQGLADVQTIAEALCGGDVRGLRDVKVAWVGDGNNVAHSLIEACALLGAEIALATPDGYEPDGDVVTWARSLGAAVEVTSDPASAVKGASVVSTDVWASMGQEDQAAGRAAVFAPYQVTADLMSAASEDAIFLHCLPAHRGEEVAADVIDGPASHVFDQAENRLHTVLAVLLHVWGLR